MDLASRAAAMTAPFWAAAARGELVRPVCSSCGRSFFTPRWACPHCRSLEWDYRPSSGIGTVYSSTVVHRGPDATWPTPYVLVIVDLEDGWSMLSRLVVDGEPEPEASYLHRRVRVRFVPEDRKPFRTLPFFALTEDVR